MTRFRQGKERVASSRRLSFASFAVLSFLLAGVSGATAQDKPNPLPAKPFIVETGAVTGLYYPVAGALCRVMNQTKGQHGRHCLVEATDGPVYNLNALRSGEADAALVQSDWQRMAFKGEGRFAPAGPFQELRAVATLYPETLTLVAKPEALIKGLADLKGKRVNYGPTGSALRNLVALVMGAAGGGPANGEGDMPPDDAAAALCDGQLDAAFFAVGHPNGTIRRAVTECGAVLLPVFAPGQEKLLADHPELVTATIPASLYPEQVEDVATIGVAATLVVRADADAAAVTALVDILKKGDGGLESQHPAFSLLDRGNLANAGRTAPLHSAAEKAYAATPERKS